MEAVQRRNPALIERTGRIAYTLVYDGTCGMCTGVAERVRVWDRERIIEVVPSQAPGVRERFHWITPTSYDQSLQLVAADGTTWQGAAAIEELIGALPRGKWIAWLFHVPLVRRIAERIYRWVARNRYRFSCSDHCAP